MEPWPAATPLMLSLWPREFPFQKAFIQLTEFILRYEPLLTLARDHDATSQRSQALLLLYVTFLGMNK